MTGLYKILIVGSGNLGSRYLEGILKSKLELEIIIFEKSQKAITNTKDLIKNINHHHHLTFYKSIKEYFSNSNIDLLINATSSNGRYKLIKDFSEKFKVRYFILEKILSNDLEDLNTFKKLFRNNCWVNTFLRTLKVFKTIKHNHYKEKINAKVFGGNWGLLCNSIHYIDLMCWMQETKIKSINTDELNHNWFESKRKDYFENHGSITVFLENGSVIKLSSKDSNENLTLLLESQFLNFKYNLITGEIIYNKLSKNIKIPFQSEMSKNLIEEIIINGNSDLTPIEESIDHHKIFINQLIIHWKKTKNSLDQSIAIT